VRCSGSCVSVCATIPVPNLGHGGWTVGSRPRGSSDEAGTEGRECSRIPAAQRGLFETQTSRAVADFSRHRIGIMNTSAPPLRYERKFIPRGHTLGEVFAIIRKHPALFHETYQARAINNIYFDTPGMGDYQDHVNGAADRTKTRIRWYGPLLTHTERPVLETKNKRGLVGRKHGYELPSFRFDGDTLRPDLQVLFDRAKMPGAVRAQLLHRHPTLVNRYYRRYFLSADRLFRLTVDSEMEFHRICTIAGELSPAAPCVPPVVIELKYGLSAADRAASITNYIPFRVERCSKYIIGLQSTSFA